MIPAKLKVMFTSFPYGGNGGTSSEVPAIRHWYAKAIQAAVSDERISGVLSQDYVDTPITMTRNKAVLDARKHGADVLVMVDSDMHPDLYLGVDKDATPFFETAFDFIYKRRMAGRPSVIGAPYCGPPPIECCYVFQWCNKESDHPGDQDMELKMYEREEASRMAGIGECAALPTGLIMFDMEVFDITDPVHTFKRLKDQGKSDREAKALTSSWFSYEYGNIYEAEKHSTEDVVATRDMGMVVQKLRGYNPLHCAWNCWAGHYKPKLVGRPRPIYTDAINERYKAAEDRGIESQSRILFVNPDGNNLVA